MILKGLVLFLLFSVGALSQDDESKGPNCTPHTCKCIGMVADVQRERSAKCWANAGLKDLENIPPEMRLFAPEKVRECLAAVPDHCEIIARGPWYWRYDKVENNCGKHCRPEKCSCPDGACKSHAEAPNY